MIKALDTAILLLIVASLLVLVLEAISQKSIRLVSEKSHIRVLALGAIAICFSLIFFDLYGNAKLERRPMAFINDISAIFLIINSIIAIFLGKKALVRSRTGEAYFLILASLALSISNIDTNSLVLKLVVSTAWLVLMVTLVVRFTLGGKRAEIALKMTISTMILVVEFLIGILLLIYSKQYLDLEFISLNQNSISFLGVVLISLSGLSLAGIPPFHFGHVDCADGGEISIAFLLLGNSFIQGAHLLLNVKGILQRSGFTIVEQTNLLALILIVGFLILWLRALDQNKIRRTIAYIALSIGPLFVLSLLFGTTVMLPKLVFLLAIFGFPSLTLLTLYGSLILMDPINLPGQTLEDSAGFGRNHPWQTLIFLVSVSTVAGLPGTLGYFIKLSLIAPLKDSIIFSGAIFLSIALGAVCVMRLFVFMFSKHPKFEKDIAFGRPPIALTIVSLVLVALGFFPYVR